MHRLHRCLEIWLGQKLRGSAVLGDCGFLGLGLVRLEGADPRGVEELAPALVLVGGGIAEFEGDLRDFGRSGDLDLAIDFGDVSREVGRSRGDLGLPLLPGRCGICLGIGVVGLLGDCSLLEIFQTVSPGDGELRDVFLREILFRGLPVGLLPMGLVLFRFLPVGGLVFGLPVG